MTPKEKAKELFDKFCFAIKTEGNEFGYWTNTIHAKNCALISVDMIDDIYQKLTPKDDPYYFLFELEYWQEVKKEIENL